MNDFAIEVKGLKEVQQKLYNYSSQLGDRVVLASLKAGARIVLRSAKRLAPKSDKPKQTKQGTHKPGTLRQGIVLRNSRIHSRRRGGKIGVYITIKEGKKYGVKDAYYGKWQEAGWEVRGKARTEENTPFRATRTGRKRFSRVASKGRSTLRSGNNVSGKFFMRDAFAQEKRNAVEMIISAATAGAEIVARRTGLK